MNQDEKLYLVLIEADKIQSYIFQTGKLTENIGASAFIDGYNRVGAYQMLWNTGWNGNIQKDGAGFKFTSQSILSDNLDYELIYSGGGNVKIILQSHDNAKSIAQKLVRLYRENTISADATWVIHEFEPNQRFDLVMQKAEREMRAKKLSKEIAVQPWTIPHLKLCQSCGKGAAVEFFKELNQEESLCQSCFKKRKKGRSKEKEIFPSFYHLLSSDLNPMLTQFNSEISRVGAKFDPDDFLPKEFDHLADSRNFIAVVVVDGNRFGKKIQSLIKDICDKNGKLQEATAKLRDFSLRVDNLAEGCLVCAVSRAFESDLTSLYGDAFEKRFIKQGQFFIPFRPIIIGGDDLTFVCAADKAFDIALKFAQILRQKSTQEKVLFGESGLSCSIGIAIVKRHFPFRSAHHLAEELVASAKRKNREYLDKDGLKRDFSTIDFSVVTTSSVDELDSRRERELRYLLNGDEYWLTGRPYLIADAQCSISDDEERREEFFTLIENAKKLRDCLAANKFKALRQIMRMGKLNSEYKWLEMASRLKEKRQKLEDVKNFYGGLWRRDTYAHKDVLINNFTDMVEIYQYLGNLLGGG